MCNYEFEKNGAATDGTEWLLIGKITDKTSADYARETLESYNIPSVLFSESGFFGQAGLNLPSFSGKGLGKFQIHVPASMREEAEGVLDMILGESWEKTDE